MINPINPIERNSTRIAAYQDFRTGRISKFSNPEFSNCNANPEMTPIVRDETQIIFEVRNAKETRNLIPKSPEIQETLKIWGKHIKNQQLFDSRYENIFCE